MPPENNLPIVNEKMDYRLREIVSRTHGVFGLCAIDLTDGHRFCINENRLFPQASAIKIPVLMEVYKKAHEGKFKLTDVRRIGKSDKTGGSGILAELGDGTVELNLHDLCVLMILVSDNTATNLLIDLVGVNNVNATLQSLGFQKTRLQRRMMDMPAAERGEENLSTPAEAAQLMELLYRGKFINHAMCDEILSILKKPKQTSVSSLLPTGTVVASKPGSIPGVTTEWAIVYAKDRPYILTVMENYGVDQEASGAIKEISKILHEHFTRLSRTSAHGVYLPKHNTEPH